MFQWVQTIQFSSKIMAPYGQWERITMDNSEMELEITAINPCKSNRAASWPLPRGPGDRII